MKEIIAALPSIDKKILTSATQRIQAPSFVGLKNPAYINYLSEESPLLTIKSENENT